MENASDRELELHLRGRDIVFDLVVSDLGGETVWRRLHDSAIPAILRLEPLPPEGVLEFSDTWNQLTNEGETVPPGTYIVEGELLTDEDPLGTPLHRLRIGEGPQR